MHPPEPTYPCYLPVLGEFSRMTPHEGLQTILAESGRCLESAAQLLALRLGDGVADGEGEPFCRAFAGAFWMASAAFFTASP